MSVVARVLQHYRITPHDVAALGSAGGFSGAEFWRVEGPAGPLCLRRWPPQHPAADRLQQIHQVLLQARRHGVPVASPRTTAAGATFVRAAGSLWELTDWLPGAADFRQRPTTARLQSALRMLGAFHMATCELALGGPPGQLASSPLLRQRWQQLQEVPQLTRQIRRRRAACWPQLAATADVLLDAAPGAASELAGRIEAGGLHHLPTPRQVVIRDVWHDHVLFVGEEVSGIVDFGAMAVDTVAADIARLLGSLVDDDSERQQVALAAYQQVRPLSPTEQQLVTIFDQTFVVLAGLNWLRWICLEGRQFSDRQAVEARLRHIQQRLEQRTS